MAPTAAPGPGSPGRLGRPAGQPPPGVRVVLDARALQAPERAPLTAIYLDRLLAAFDAEPLAGESFAFLLSSDLPDPTGRFGRLDVAGRRLLPPTRLLRGAALTVDPVLLSGASLGAGWRVERHGAAGAVYHAVAGTLPLATRLPLVVTLLDLAPWELARAYQRTVAQRFGQRLRARLVRDAQAVIVGSAAVAAACRRRLHVRPDRLRVVPLAPRPAFARDAGEPERGRERERLGLPQRYLVHSGRYDARHDVPTVLRAIARLAADGRPSGLAAGEAWPPHLLLVGASPDDRAAVARLAAGEGVGDALAYAPALAEEREASLVAGAHAAVVPALHDAAGLAAIEALASGTPVVATTAGPLPEIVGSAGILVEPRDPDRLAAAIRALWSDAPLHERLRAEARARAAGRRSWADVARETRAVYADAAARAPTGRRGR